MAFGSANKLAVIMLVVIAFGMFASAMNFVESNDMAEDLPACKVVIKKVSNFLIIQGVQKMRHIVDIIR
jgi:hypothetical protein